MAGVNALMDGGERVIGVQIVLTFGISQIDFEVVSEVGFCS